MRALEAVRSLNTRSVRFRTTAGAVLALTILLAIAGFGINWFVGRQIQQAFDSTLIEQATDRGALLSEGAPVESLMNAVGDEAIVAAVDSNGTVVASAGAVNPDDVLAWPDGVSNVETEVIERGEGPHLETLRAAVVRQPDGSAFVVANEGEATQQTRAAVRNVLLLVIPLIAAAGAALAWVITGRALEPVKTMRAELDEVVDASGGRRVVRPGTGDEIDDLGGSINGVLDRLDAASMARRRFVADASHELKSPLANARIIIETASTTPDEREHLRVTTAVGVELNRLHSLVDDLLYLAREDEAAPPSISTFDLADIVFDEAERSARTTTKTVDASHVGPTLVLGDPAEVTRAVRNLIENAERFAHRRVELAVATDAQDAVLTVSDDGPGIASADRERIFERFARVDTDRTRSAGGTGLGLAIVASVASRNGGSVTVGESSSGGAEFVLTIPLGSTS